MGSEMCIRDSTYTPPSSRFHGIDGAFFGTTFPHFLLQCYRDLAPSIIAPEDPDSPESPPAGKYENAAESTPSVDMRPPSRGTLVPERLGRKPPQCGLYTPRIYGFRVSEFAPSGPRMQWLRMRPHSLAELE